MNNNLTFILKLQDLLTPAMRQAARISDTSANRITSEFERINRGGRRMGASVNELRNRLNAVNQVRFGTTIEREFNVATRAANRLERQIERLENNGRKKSGGGGGMLGNFVKGNLIAGAISGGLGMARDFVGDINATALKNSSLKTAINSTTGGQGKEAVAQTAAISDKYGLNYEASLEGVKTLTGGLKSMNLPLKEQMQIFEGVSTGIAAMKLGAEESKGAMLALGQMASKGTVSAEELRGQLGERIPGAFGIAARAMNVTEAQLGKMMQKGEIAAKDFLPKFAAEMQKSFGADALEAGKGPAAMQERFTKAIFLMKAAIGEGLMPLITPLVEKFTKLAIDIIPKIQKGIEYVVNLFSGINEGSNEWGHYLNIVKVYANQLWTTIKSLAANVWNIIGGMIEWIKKSELMKDVASGMGKLFGVVLKTIEAVGNTIQWIWEKLIKPILDAVEKVYGYAKGLLGGGKSEIVVTSNTAKIIPMAPSGAFLPKLSPDQMNTGPIDWIPDMLKPKKKGDEGTGLGKTTKDKSDSINSGGQRSVVINIGKQIEKIEQHIIGGGKEAADEIEGAVREAMRRVVYSMNGIAV